MYITLLKSKLHRACVTHSERDYDGSCAIDGILLDKAGIHEHEQIQLYNIENGERLTTYAIRAEENSRIISVNGAASHKAGRGDRIIICAYTSLSEDEIKQFKPTLVYLDQDNNIIRIKDCTLVQASDPTAG